MAEFEKYVLPVLVENGRKDLKIVLLFLEKQWKIEKKNSVVFQKNSG